MKYFNVEQNPRVFFIVKKILIDKGTDELKGNQN